MKRIKLVDPRHDALTRRTITWAFDTFSDHLSSNLRRNIILVGDLGKMFEYTTGKVVERRGHLPGLLADGRRGIVDESFGKGAELIFDGAEPIGDLAKLFFTATERATLDPLPCKALKERREVCLGTLPLLRDHEEFFGKITGEDRAALAGLLRHGYGHLTYVTGWVQRTPGVRKTQEKETS